MYDFGKQRSLKPPVFMILADKRPNFMSTYHVFSVLNVKALVGTFNQERALVGAVIVKPSEPLFEASSSMRVRWV